jgi:Protein kinase domain
VTAPESSSPPAQKTSSNPPSPTGSRSPTAGPQRPGSSSGLSSEGRFLPGTLLSERYRIVALQGRGGMGEVYRADDLVLGQPVALKFLPEAAARNEDLLNRFRNEVRTARRVSNPNVCRVYDVGEAEGQTFLSMEYVDGEDLASLLRRIGRLPGDKGLEIARQLCAGLGAAHKEGVLHRDLKPANVMLDGRGRAIITDFGLAGLADNLQAADVRSGTPAYMAPEQMSGREVTAKSDIYALGLVLYEIFTGKRAFEADTLAELVRLRNEKPLGKPSSWVKDLDPAVERVIMRCLEPDPAARPSSALAVAAALPGGDPLAAALAAGETPSPELVAAAGETEGLPPRVALACLALVVAGLAVTLVMGARMNMINMLRPDYSADAMAVKARDILKGLGYVNQPADTADGFYYDMEFINYAQKNDKPMPDWGAIVREQHLGFRFWYRQSPRDLVASDFRDDSLTPGIVASDDPPRIISGMVRVNLDDRGRLLLLEAVPPEKDDHPQPVIPVDWKPLFAAAGLDPAQLKPTEPEWNSLAASDSRVAWTGTWPGSSRPLHVEAAAYRGRPVYFSMTGPWTKPARMVPEHESRGVQASDIILVLVGLVILFGAAFLARRNYSQGKGDRHGASQLAWAVFALQMALWLCRAHLLPSLSTFGLFVIATSTGLFWAAVLWLVYLALEPYVRRHWPQTLISWSRLMAGRWRDPLVGRDILFGVLLGLAWMFVVVLSLHVDRKLGGFPHAPTTDFLFSTRATLGVCLSNVSSSIRSTLIFFFVLFLLRVLLRNPWLVVAAFVAIFAAPQVLTSDNLWLTLAINVIIYAIAAGAAVRFGLITLAVGIFTVDILLNAPLTLDLTAWFASSSIFVLALVLALAAWGFYTSLAGQKLLKEDLFQ